MKLRGLMVAVVLLGGLAGLLYWSNHHKPGEGTTKALADTPPAILKLDEGSITKVALKRKDAEPILLAKAQSGAWEITAPKALAADQDAVGSVVSALASLNSERLVEDKATDLSQYGLSTPAVEVDLREKDNKAQRLLLGDNTPAGDAVYAMLAGDPRVFTISSYSKGNLVKTVDDLRDKRLLTLSPENMRRIELTRKDQTIEFGRAQDGWQILKPRPLRADNLQVGELARKLSAARMDLSGTGAKDAATAFAHAAPVATVTVTGEPGTQELQIRKDKDTYYAKASLVKGAYKVDADLGRALAKSLDDFREKKLFVFGFSDPSKIEVHSGSKAYDLARNGEDWSSGGKKMDAASVEDLVAKLRDLTASKFVESGFGSPSVEATVTSQDGKRVEKVLISKSGSGYIAKRENEPSLYQLDASVVEDLQKAAEDIKPAATPRK